MHNKAENYHALLHEHRFSKHCFLDTRRCAFNPIQDVGMAKSPSYQFFHSNLSEHRN